MIGYPLRDIRKEGVLELMTLAEAARELGLARDTLKIQAQHGRLRAEKIGRDWLVTRAEVERYRRDVQGTRGRRGVSEPRGVLEPDTFGAPRPAPKPSRKRHAVTG